MHALTCTTFKNKCLFLPGALLGVVGGAGVLNGSKSTASKLEEVLTSFFLGDGLEFFADSDELLIRL